MEANVGKTVYVFPGGNLALFFDRAMVMPVILRNGLNVDLL